MSELIDVTKPAAEQDAIGMVARLRAQTRSDHARVDAAFSQFDLTCSQGYAGFLTAQARVLPALETLLRPAETIPGWQGRAALLLQDLRALNLPAPQTQTPQLPPGGAAWWGALYVMEGSRLGGAVLARRVPDHFPKAFLTATHPPGAWRELLTRIDHLALDRNEQSASIAAAKSVFSAFERAARDQS